MQFNQYKQNSRNYIDRYYQELIEEVNDRPESSFPVLFEEELSTIQRYTLSLHKEVLFHIQDDLESKFPEEIAEQKMNEITGRVKPFAFTPIHYVPREEKKESTLIKVKQPEDNHVGRKSQASATEVMGASILSGTVVGALIGSFIGKTAIFPVFGGLFGGLFTGTASYYYTRKIASTNSREPAPRSQPQSTNVKQVITERKQEIAKSLDHFIDRLEAEYIKIAG